MKPGSVSRRTLLGALGFGAGAIVLDGFLGLRHARADAGDPDTAPLLVMCEFASGWDTLYSLDPRNHQVFNDPNGGIYTGWDMVTDPGTVAALDATGGTGLVQPPGSNIQFGPAIGKLASHHEDLCVVRAMHMGTLTHEVGRRYFLTGKFPRGLAASGSSLETWWAAASGTLDGFQIPNLVAGGAETYNEGLSPNASALRVPGYAEMLQVLRPLNAAYGVDGKVTEAAAKFHQDDYCLHAQLDANGSQVKNHLSAWASAQSLANGGLWKHFDFKANPPAGSPLENLYQKFNVNPANPAAALSGKPRGQAALAAQALVNGISQVVLMRLVNVTDAHFDDDWPTNHPRLQRDGFEAVAELISYLKDTYDKNGKPYWDRTTLLCFSEFARTPRINAQGGRDHHLASACLVAGAGIKGNQVIGATKDTNYDVRPLNLDTGIPDDEMGVILRPSDIHATILEAAGLPHDHISNQSPKIVKAMLKNA